MARRILAFVLVLAMLVCVMPQVTVGVSAEGAKAPGASEWCDHTNHDGWTEIKEGDPLPKTTGKYYLSGDVNLKAAWDPGSGSEIHLCLNGHNITQTVAGQRVINVSAGRNLSIYDCAKAYEGDTYVGGKITGGNKSNGSAVWISRGGSAGNNPGVFNLYGGRITGNANAEETYSGAVYLQSGKQLEGIKRDGAVFNMYGGEIVGNGTKSKSVGGGVYLHGEDDADRGGKPATFHMYDGLISENKGATGGAVSGIGDAVIDIRGGELSDNEVSGNGGAIYTQDDMALTVADTTITGNKSKNASAIYAQNKVHITFGTDAKVTGNEASSDSAEGYGAAVYICGSGTKVTLTGKPVISGNKMKNPAIADLFFNSKAGFDIETLYVDEVNGGDVKFGVKDKTVTEASDVVALASGGTQNGLWQSEWVTYVDATGATKSVTYGTAGFYFVEGHYHGDQKYVEWSETNKLPKADDNGVGYYLANNVTVTSTSNKARVTTGTLHLCLNGKTVSQNMTDASKSETSDIFRVDGGSLYMSDCTTVYDEDGCFVSGGKIAGGKKLGNGAALYINKAASVVEVTGVEFYNNENTQKNADYGGAAVMARYNTTPAKFTGCKFADNQSATGGAGAIALRDGGKVTAEKCLFTGNSAKHGGAIYCLSATLVVKDSKFTANTAANAAAINVLGTSNVTVESCEITGNSNTSADGYGAVNLANGNSVVRIKGKTTIYNNLNKDGKQQNLHLQHSTTTDIDYDVSGLTAGSKVGISLFSTRFTSYPYFSTTGMTSNPGYCISDHEDYEVKLNETTTRLELVKKSVTPPSPPPAAPHTHKLCNDASCTAHGGDVTFKAWGDDADEVGLPTSGDWYLYKNIDVSAATTLTGNLNLCLNGKTITQTGNNRIYTINTGFKLAITDCAEAYTGDTYTGGLITGGKQNTGSAVFVTSGTTFALYGGRIANCGPSTTTSAQTGAAVFLHSANSAGATFNMYGGEITECGGNKCWGGAVSNGGGNTGKTVYVNIYGGKIFGNTAMDGAAMRLRTAAVATISGGEIYGNTATNTGGAILLDKGAELKLQGGNIHDNTAAVSGGAIKASATASQITLSGVPTVQNNKVGTAQNNLFLEGDKTFKIDGLTTGAKIGLSRTEGRTTEEVSSNTATTADLEFFTNDDTQNYQLKLKNDRVALTVMTDHMHKLCNDDTCNEHDIVPFARWEKTDSLPGSGNWYLESDVELTAAAQITGDLQLCLNGHTVRQTTTNRVISVSKDVELTITDCNAVPGALTNGVSDFGSAIYLNEGSVLNLYGGKITGNVPKSANSANTGAAIFMRSANKGGATFNMYGGEIFENGNRYSWGGAVSNGSGNANKPVYVNIYGGKIYNHNVGTGGAIRLENSSVLTIAGGEITGNTANIGGAVYLNKGAELKLQGGKISGNTAGLGGGIYMTTANTVTVSGAPVVMDNTVNGKQNNLYLDGNAVITLGTVGADAKVGVSVSKVDRVISTESGSDFTKNFVSDSSYKIISYQNKTLSIAGASDHNHCVCDSTVSACDHTRKVWTAWESASSLPTTSGYYYLTADVKLSAAADIPSNQEIYLCLNGKTVSGSKRHVIVGNGTVMSVTDCNEVPGGFTGGMNTYGGSVNVTSGGTFNLYAGKLYGNTAPDSEGGAIYMQAGRVKDNTALPGGIFNMYGGEISGNTAKIGAAIRAAGTNEEGIAPSQINIYGGTISGNKAESTGGAIAATNGTVINLLGGTIDGNTSKKDGAGIYANAKSVVTIKDAKITNNVSGGFGGGIFATSNGTVITMDSGEMSGNTSNAGGAVMLQTRAVFNMNGGKISGNKELKSGGGGLYISTNTDFVMNGGEISGNTSTGNGAGFYALRSRVKLNGGVICDNESKARAGGFAACGAEMEINKVTIRGNTAKEGGAAYINRIGVTSQGVTTYYPSAVNINEGALITGNKAQSNCGGILMANDEVVVTMNGGEISKNTSTNGAGVMTWKGSTFVMKGGKITNHTVKGSGGGLYVSTGSTFKMEGGSISNNTAKSGGGVYFLRATGVLSGGTIGYNHAKEEVKWTNGKETKSGGMAGGFYASGTKLEMKGTNITGNKADSNGGGIVMGRASYKENGVTKYDLVKVNIYGGVISGNVSGASAGGMLMQSDGTVVNMYGGTFTKNTSAKSGGGIYVSTKTILNMSGGRVIENHSETTGGGIYVYKSTANITGGELNNNTAITNGGNMVASGGTAVANLKNIKLYGGMAKTAGSLVVQSKGSILNVENCEIYDNKSESATGGAVFVSTRAFGNFTNCKFFDNHAETWGGAVLVNNFANATFTGCEFYDNYAVKQGGAMWCSVASKTTIDNTHFYKNSTGGRGGALVCKGDLTLKNSVIENNTASEDGGGVYTDTNSATGSGIMHGMVVENSVIRNNTATLQGGGMFIHKGCRMEIYDSEITGNKAGAEGGAMWVYEDLELHDTSITGNTSGGEGYAVYMNDAMYDGHSYFTSRNKLSGNVVIKDNDGGDLWMGPDVVFAITADGLGDGTHIELTMDSGVVTNRILGAYHYEGGDQVYTITSGDRSITDPEYDASLVPGADKEAKVNAGDIVLYVGIGVFVIAIIAVAVLLITKKKKAGKTAEEVTKE